MISNLLKNSIVKTLTPFLFIIVVCAIFFYPVWTKNLIPMPSDIIVGVYHPWIDYRWPGFPAGVPVKNPLLSDVPSLLYPQRFYAFEELKKGIIPFWNTTTFNGYPMIANFQAAFFYPLNLFYLILPFAKGWTLEVILQPILAGVFTYIFLNNLKLSKVASLLGSIAYAFGGFSSYYLEYNVHGHVAALIPLFLYLVDRFVSTKKMLYLVFLSFATAVQIFAGYPQITLYCLILLFFWVLIRVKNLNKNKFYMASLIYLFIFLGLILAAVQIIPGLELYSSSQRLTEVLSDNFRFLQPQKLVTIFAPDYFGNPSTYNYWGEGDYTNHIAYTGVTGFILAFLALAKFRKKVEVNFFSYLALLLLIINLNTPIGRGIVNIFFDSVFKGFRAASMTRSLVLFNLSLATLAAFGLNYFIKEKNPTFLIRKLYAPSILIIGTFLVTLIAWFKLKNELLASPPGVAKLLSLHEGNYSTALRNLGLPMGVMIAVLMIILITCKIGQLRKVGSYFFLLLTLIELFRFGWKVNPFSKEEFLYPKTSLFNFLNSESKPFRISPGDAVPDNMWMPYNLESSNGYDAVFPYASGKILGIIDASSPSGETTYRATSIRNFDTKLINLLNIKYILALKFTKDGLTDSKGDVGYKFTARQFKKILDDGSVAVLENKDVYPRAFFVSSWDVVKNSDQTFKLLLDKNYPLNKKIILEKPAPFAQSDSNTNKVNYLDYSSTHSKISVANDKDGFLFISDTWYPGWKALVDGKSVNIEKADFAFRAIPLKRGLHIVRMFYQPQTFYLGGIVSLFGLILIGGILFTQSEKVSRNNFKL